MHYVGEAFIRKVRRGLGLMGKRALNGIIMKDKKPFFSKVDP